MRKFVLLAITGVTLVYSAYSQVPSKGEDLAHKPLSRVTLKDLAEATFAPVPKPPSLPPGVEVYFSPQDDLAGKIVSAINSASTEVLVNEYILTNSRIARALVDAFKRRKVSVIVLLDGAPRVAKYYTPYYFQVNGVPVFASTNTTGGFDNNKYMVIDRTKVITGSMDGTDGASRNNENLLILDEVGIATLYYNDFVRRLRTSTQFNIPEQ